MENEKILEHISYNIDKHSDVIVSYNVFNNERYHGSLQLFRCRTTLNYNLTYVWLHRDAREEFWRNVDNNFAKDFLKIVVKEMKQVDKLNKKLTHNRTLGKSFSEIENNQTEISEKRKEQLSYIK